MDSTTILIIDKDILVRRAITTILQKKQQFQVYWTDAELEDIESIVEEKQPDIVLLSVESIEGEGLDYLQRLKSTFSRLPVVVISPRSEKGAQAALTSLRLGATDFLTKPEAQNLILFAERHLEKRLDLLLKAIRKIERYQDLNKRMLESCMHPQRSFDDINAGTQGNESIDIAVMGGCTGGVQSLFGIASSLSADLSFPIVVVQHLPRIFTQYLATSLDATCPISVREIQNEDELLPGTMYVAPGGYQCEVSRSGVNKYFASVFRGPREHNMRPSIDVLFRSVARVSGHKAMAILLSGCGRDGLQGAEEIKNQGGQVIVEDPRTAIAPALPLSAMTKGLANAYYATDGIAGILSRSSTISTNEELMRESSEVTKSLF